MIKKPLIFLLIAGMGFGLSACGSNGLKETPTNEYYDVAGLIKNEIQLLDSLNPAVDKEVTIDGEKENSTLHFDSLGWAHELEVFTLIDINEPVLKDEYDAFESKLDSGRVLTYRAKKKSLGVENIHLTFNNSNQLQKLEATYSEKNALYTSTRDLEMHFQPLGKQVAVSQYAITGKQKMILKDPVNFTIKSKVKLKP